MRKNIAFLFFALLIAFPFQSAQALPAEDVQLVTDAQYFQVAKKMIQEAKSSIHVMMFEMGYYEKYSSSPSNLLIQELIEAKNRGVKVSVILEVREGKDRTSERNLQTGKLLASKGVEVIYDPLFKTTHAKWIVADEKLSLVGSTNWTYYALTNNHEVAILIRSKELAKALVNYFEQIKAAGSQSQKKE